MSKGLAFWIIMLIFLVLGGWTGYLGGDLRISSVTFLLLALLGWQVFGFPVK